MTKTYNLYKNDRGRFLGIFNYKKKGTFLGSVNASEDLSFEVKKGEAVAFLGRNGRGQKHRVEDGDGCDASDVRRG